MDLGHLLLAALFGLTILHLITLKICSVKLDHRTAPLFISVWTLLGLAAVYPLYGGLLAEGVESYAAKPWLLALTIGKGGLLCYLFVLSQELMKVSLSSRHYVTPMAIGLVTISNGLLGERLMPHEMFAAFGLCALACAFFFKGHLSELDRRGRLSYAKLVLISAALSTLDHVLTKDTNWYTLLAVSYAVVFVAAVIWNARSPANFRAALLGWQAALAGIAYAATELVKFYQQVAINPVTVVVIVQALTKPVILVLSAVIWKERTVKEQLVWGAAAFLIALPLFLPAEVISGFDEFFRPSK
ncbi:MAG TPA: hypothetical protein VEF76_10005 [Patescibacteria group bacterium]|nr:hypothetical protein [Patescibacteria group bacterium]